MFAPQKMGKDWRLNKIGRRRMVASCSALVKVLPDASDIYTSHVTWNAYQAMIRILKKYNFEVHRTAAEDSPLVTGHSMSFSSYPGLLYSGDDFTVISSGLVTMETTIGNNSKNILTISFFRKDRCLHVDNLIYSRCGSVQVHQTYWASP